MDCERKRTLGKVLEERAFIIVAKFRDVQNFKILIIFLLSNRLIASKNSFFFLPVT